MVEVFITDITSETRSSQILQALHRSFPEVKMNFDLENVNQPFPCGHSILRVEGNEIDPESIQQFLKNESVLSEILEDKICS